MEFTGIDKLSLLDYEDYVSVVLFTPKCNFRCPFCHNGKTVLESDVEIDFDEILSYLQTRKGLIDAVVITGGEPTLMPELKERIIKIKELGLRVKLDTNGSNPEVLKDLVNSKLLDYVAMDIKNSMNEYPRTCGVHKVDENKLKESINFLLENNVDYEFRTTLVKELHDIDDIYGIGEIVKGAKRFYFQKFTDHGYCIEDNFHEVEIDAANKYLEIIKKYCENANLRGY